jgi:acyl carrier protein
VIASAIDARAEEASMMKRVVELFRETADVQGVGLPSERQSLFDAGVLDSFGLLEFLTAVEKDLNIRIPDEDSSRRTSTPPRRSAPISTTDWKNRDAGFYRRHQ